MPKIVQSNIDSLVPALTKAFTPQGLSDIKRAELQALVRKPSEDLFDFSLNVRRPNLDTNAIDTLANDMFIAKLRDRNLRLKLRHLVTQSFDELVSAAIQWETIEKADKAMTSVYMGTVQT